MSFTGLRPSGNTDVGHLTGVRCSGWTFDDFVEVWLRVQDNVGDVHTWPELSARLFNGSDPFGYQDRFTLTLFLWGNGAPPALIREYFATCGRCSDM